ncbi:MAG TPA: TraR/DksA C4-type zinc finger protein [Acidimicrobiales bacterium]|nr:TraR/DksA C4-type zinc finger protein [Acidimicrobiales bacterium]
MVFGMSNFAAGFQTQLMAQRGRVQSQLASHGARTHQITAAEYARHERHGATLRRMLEHIDAALGKHEEGTYGQCDGCGGTIAEADLMADPTHTLCAKCRGHEEE